MHSLERYNPDVHTSILYAAAMDGVDTALLEGGERYIGFGDTKYGYGPACILDVVSTPYVAEPHVTWMPWTRPKDRIVNFKWAMNYLSETRQVFLTVEKKEIAFFEYFTKRGLLRKVGFLNNLPIVEEIHMYQYERKVS